MGLINFVLKAVILLLDLRDTYDAFEAVKLEEIGCSERRVLVRNAQDGTKQMTSRKRVGTAKRKAAVKSALTTVLLWNLFNKVEPVCDRTIAWFVPFYDSFKTLFLIWMLFTRSYGASILIYRVLAPIIKPYEPIMDAAFELSAALFGYMAALIAPFAAQCAAFALTAKAAIGLTAASAGSESEPAVANMLSVGENGPKRKTSLTSMTAQSNKKPPPPSASPPSFTKASPASATASLRDTIPRPQSRVGTTRVRQELAAKSSQSNLAATRRVLQELPVPRHAFVSTPPKISAPAANSPSLTGGAHRFSAVPTASSNDGSVNEVKTEPTEPNLSPPAAALAPPPTPPSGLQNYAFIPGMTPQRAGPASLVSPTPRFPGGFSFSAAATQASTSTGANPFQAQARVPLTTQMAPLSLAPPTALQPTLPNSVTNSIPTHENVASANDDRIVPPPNPVASVRKVSSSRLLKGKASAQVADKPTKRLNGKKRAHPDEDIDGEDDEAGKSTMDTASQKKRVRSANGKATDSKTGVAAAHKINLSAPNGRSSVQTSDTAHRRKPAAKSTKSKAPSVASDSTRTSALAESESTASATTSPQKRAKPTANKAKATSTKTAAPRTAAQKASSTSQSRSESAEASEASQPAQRLSRSRTKQNLAD